LLHEAKALAAVNEKILKGIYAAHSIIRRAQHRKPELRRAMKDIYDALSFKRSRSSEAAKKA
jgi:hypothetical protein